MTNEMVKGSLEYPHDSEKITLDRGKEQFMG